MKTSKDIPQKNPFKVPDNYFEAVNRKILALTDVTSTIKPRKGLSRMMKPFLAAAASLVFFVLLSYTLVKIIQPGNKNEILPEISFEDFSSTYLNDIDIITLEEEADKIVFYDRIPEVSSEDIIDYLILENCDPLEIYDNL